MPTEVTLLLQRWREGDESALHALMPLIYSELHRMARLFLRNRRPGETLQPTALLNEAYLKLFDTGQPHLLDRAHFLAVMSRVMRQVLIDHARAAAAISVAVRRNGSIGIRPSSSSRLAARANFGCSKSIERWRRYR